MAVHAMIESNHRAVTRVVKPKKTITLLHIIGKETSVKN